MKILKIQANRKFIIGTLLFVVSALFLWNQLSIWISVTIYKSDLYYNNIFVVLISLGGLVIGSTLIYWSNKINSSWVKKDDNESKEAKTTHTKTYIIKGVLSGFYTWLIIWLISLLFYMKNGGDGSSLMLVYYPGYASLRIIGLLPDMYETMPIILFLFVIAISTLVTAIILGFILGALNSKIPKKYQFFPIFFQIIIVYSFLMGFVVIRDTLNALKYIIN